MKLRTVKNHVECESSTFNIISLDEIIFYYNDGSGYSLPISDFDVFLESLQMWKFMPDAFRDVDLIRGEFNDRFREPMNEEERQRGWY